MVLDADFSNPVQIPLGCNPKVREVCSGMPRGGDWCKHPFGIAAAFPMGTSGLTEHVCMPEPPWISSLSFPGCEDLWICSSPSDGQKFRALGLRAPL